MNEIDTQMKGVDRRDPQYWALHREYHRLRNIQENIIPILFGVFVISVVLSICGCVYGPGEALFQLALVIEGTIGTMYALWYVAPTSEPI